MTDQRILVVDPGKMTGWGFLDVLVTERGYRCDFTGGEMEHDTFTDWILDGWLTAVEIDLVIVEGFVVGPRTIQQCPDDRKLWSVKQIGTLEASCRRAKIPLRRQLPSDKSFGSDDFLKRVGWWDAAPGVTGEKGHRRDAARHALKYAVDHQYLDLRRLAP